jgi:hypothetical protein
LLFAVSALSNPLQSMMNYWARLSVDEAAITIPDRRRPGNA